MLLALRQGWLREKARGWAWLAANGSMARRAPPGRSSAPGASPTASSQPFSRLSSTREMLQLPAGVAVVNGFVSAWWRGARVFL